MKKNTRKAIRRVVRDAKDNWDYIWSHFRGDRASDEFLKIVEDVIDRVDFEEVNEDTIYDIAYQEIDDSLIYTEDQWEVMKHYQSPNEADFDSAMEEFTNDIIAIIEEIASDKEDTEEE